MSRRKMLFLSCLTCISIITLLFVFLQSDFLKEEIVYADHYDDLQLYAEYSVQTEKINIWKGEECYYFFLPSNIKYCNLFFGNLRQEDYISINGHIYKHGDELSSQIEFETVYDMLLYTDKETFDTQQIVFMQSADIPAVFLETASGTTDNIHADKSIKEPASIVILNKEGNCEYRGNIEYVKTRGNSTFYEADKKSYQLKLFNESELLGMAEEKKWLLLANAHDASLIRNKLVYDFAAEYTNIPSIDGVYVDLYMNGNYSGCYFLCEKVEVSKNRLNITNLDEKNQAENAKDNLKNGAQYISEDGRIRAVAGLHNPPDITGGYLIEKDTADAYESSRCGFITNSGQYYCVISPENATIEQVQYISSLFNELEEAINQPNGINPNTDKHFSEYLDVKSWVSKYLMDEVFSDPDTPSSSTYFYKDSDEVDPLIYSGPMWDYDRALGGYFRQQIFIDDPAQIGYRGVYAKNLLQHEDVMKLVLEEYQNVILPYADNEFNWRVTLNQREIKAAAEMDRLRWPQFKSYYTGWESNGDYLKAFMKKKIDYLNELWLMKEQYHTVTFLDYAGNVYDTYQVKHGEYLSVIPNITSYGALFDGWYCISTGKLLDIRFPVLEDATYQSYWIELSILLENGLNVADINIQDIDIQALEALVNQLKEKQKE